MDVSKERKKELKRAYKEKAAEEELHKRIRNLDDFRRLWKELVPLAGPADSLQGELLRAVENLRDESFRNGNRNFGPRHLGQCRLLLHTLNHWPDFTADARDVYSRMIGRIEAAGLRSMEYSCLSARERRRYKGATDCTDEYVYDLLLELFTDFALRHPEKIPFEGYPAAEAPAPPPPSPSRLMDEWVKRLFTQYCKPLGYKKEGANFRLILPDGLGKVVNFQRNRYNTARRCSFTVNTGIYLEQDSVLKNTRFKEYQCLVRRRPRLSPPDPWWTIEEGKASGPVWAAMEETFSKAVLPWLDAFPSRQETLERLIESLRRQEYGDIPQPVYLAGRLASWGYGQELLPILQSERFLRQNRRLQPEIMQIIAQIEAEETH